jgi:hypothetical protein
MKYISVHCNKMYLESTKHVQVLQGDIEISTTTFIHIFNFITTQSYT